MATNLDHAVETSSPLSSTQQPPTRKWFRSPALAACGVAFLLLILVGQLWYSVYHESLSWDEGNHLFAGYMSVKHGDFGLNPEHPPLIKMVAAVPLLFMNLHEPTLQNRYFKSESYLSGRDLIYGNDFNTIIFRARMSASVFAVLLALLVFFTAREMFGPLAGYLALILIVFEPNLLAHGAMVTTDTGAACFLLATIFAFYRYVKAPSIGRLIAVGIAGGLMGICKHSALTLIPMVALLALVEVVRHRRNSAEPTPAKLESRFHLSLRLAGAIALSMILAVGVIWSCYGFRYQARPAGFQLNPPLKDTLSNLSPVEAKAITASARWHLLPESYIYGLADVRSVANVWPSYVFGKVYAHGVWFYFPVAFLIKATLTTLILLLLAVLMMATGKLQAWREVWFLTIPPAVYLSISITSKLNIGVRHILLVFIFVLILGAGGAAALIRSNRRWAYLIAALVCFHIVSSLQCFPTSYMAYANELWGGPSSTYKYLTDSNTDWGQQLKATKLYLDQHNIKDCWFAYFVEPAIRYESYGIPCKTIITPDNGWFGAHSTTPPIIHGTVLVSQSDLTGYEWGTNLLNPYRDLEKQQPTAIIEHGIWVFDGTFDLSYAAATEHALHAQELLNANQPEQALAEAQAGLALSPKEFIAQLTEADILKKMHREAEARTSYEKALAIAHTMEPSAQEKWIPDIEGRMAAK